MATSTNIQVWAFNNFTTFDKFVSQLGTSTQAVPTYDRKDSVKMVSSLNHGQNVPGMILELEKFGVGDSEISVLRNKIYRKNGQIRQGLKEIKFHLNEMFIVFKFC